jgi:uncharacterized LabA/DUF88 family protein
MSRLACFLDGGYVDRIARDEFQVRLDYGKLSTALVANVGHRSGEPVSLLRTYYYHCLPYQSAQPTAEEAKRFGQSRSFFDALAGLPRTEVRLGRLAFRGTDSKGQPIFQQKRVDLMLGLDFALLAGKHQIGHAVLFAGDSDLIPAVEVAKQEGVCVWLVHGPSRSRANGTSTYARELWEAADERIELTPAFIAPLAR